MPPPIGVVIGPLMPITYSSIASRVSWGSHHSPLLSGLVGSPPLSVTDFSPAKTSIQAIERLPPKAFCTAASSTRTDAFQMSGPVPSPSMKQMIGRSGTISLPFWMVIFCPLAGLTGRVGLGLAAGSAMGGSEDAEGVWTGHDATVATLG